MKIYTRISLLTFLFFSTIVFGQVATDGDYRSKATGNWSSTSTWQVRTSSSWGDAGSAPTSSNNVYVQTGHTVTVDASSACYDLHINTTGVLAIGTNTLQVNGKIRAYTGSAVTSTGADGTFYSGQTSATNTGTSTITSSGSGVLKFVGSTRNITNTGEWGAYSTGYSAEFGLTSGQTGTLVTSFKAAGITISSGTVSVSTGLNFQIDNGAATGPLTINTGAQLTMVGTGTICRSGTAGANSKFGTFTLDGTLEYLGSSPGKIDASTINFNGTVKYSYTTSQTLTSKPASGTGADPLTYTNLILSTNAAGTKTLSGNTTINGTLTLSGGTGAGTALSLGGFTLTYGGSSILQYAGSAAQTTTSTELPSSSGPTSLTIANSNGVTLGASATINGTLTLTSGAFNNSSQTLSLGNSASIVMAGGSLTAQPTFGTSINITYSGSGSQTTSFEVPSADNILNNLTISNSSGVILGASASVKGTLALSSGDLDLNGNTLTLSSSATLSETAGNTVKGSTGIITTTRLLNAPSGNTVGGIGVVITSAANMGLTVVSRAHAAQSGNSHTGITRYFDITPTNNSSLNATLVFNYDESELNGITEANLGIYRAESPYSTWTLVGGTVDVTNNNVTVTGVNTFSRWTLGDVTSPLPVKLTSFISNVEGNKVELNWRTATEVNNYGFEILRSAQNDNWEKIGFVQGNGNSNSPKNYSFTDEPTGGKEFKYRLKQIDFDGAFEYSFEITAALGNISNYKLDQNYPNPFNPVTKISYTIPQRTYVHLRVYDMLAKQVAELVNASQEAGRYESTFDGSKLPSGVYFYKLEAGKYIEVKKLLLVK